MDRSRETPYIRHNHLNISVAYRLDIDGRRGRSAQSPIAEDMAFILEKALERLRRMDIALQTWRTHRVGSAGEVRVALRSDGLSRCAWLRALLKTGSLPAVRSRDAAGPDPLVGLRLDPPPVPA